MCALFSRPRRKCPNDSQPMSFSLISVTTEEGTYGVRTYHCDKCGHYLKGEGSNLTVGELNRDVIADFMNECWEKRGEGKTYTGADIKSFKIEF